MSIIKLLMYVENKVRINFFPTDREKEVSRYFADGGDEQFRLDFHLTKDSLVLDLGGYKGQWASDIYAMYNCKILVFEPVNMFYTKIRVRFKLNPQIKSFCLALGDKNGTAEIGLSNDGSSQFISGQKKEIIDFVDVAQFFSEHNIEEVDLIKINIEGGEYALLRRLIETGLIKGIKQIHVQFHDFVPDAESQMNDIVSKLSLTHDLTMRYKFVWENWKLKE